MREIKFRAWNTETKEFEADLNTSVGCDEDGTLNTGEWRVRYKGNNLSLFDIFNKCEVIGNIYENPELLEENK